MTLQNRVMPDGSIVAVAAKGTLMGNRGILHGADQTLGTTRWRHKAWVCCELQFKGRHRAVMQPGHYTELFFLDEAVALAAGHRPCAECRRADHLAFRAAWFRAFGTQPSAPEMDRALHAARIDPRTKLQATHQLGSETLPNGTFIRQNDTACLLQDGSLRPFSPDGYGPARPLPEGEVTVLTPAPTVAVLAAGYRPRLHPSAP